NNSPLPQKRRNHVSDGYAIPKHGCSLHPTPEEVGFTAQRIKNQKTDTSSERQNTSLRHQSHSNSATNGVNSQDLWAQVNSMVTCFGKKDWETHFGSVGKEPPLPKNILEILNSQCPFHGDTGSRIKDTHVLVLIPNTVNRKPLTLNEIDKLAQTPKSGHPTRGITRTQLNDTFPTFIDKTEIKSSYWVLMTKTVLPDPTFKEEEMEVKVAESVEDPTGFLESKGYATQGYSLPSCLEIVTCVLITEVKSGERLYQDKATLSSEYRAGERNLCVGTHYQNAFYVYRSPTCRCASRVHGIAALRKLT
ncbi:MAG: hypothetical protein JSR97_09490, partial [Verrucomicrobia bacterium]|nr:hypothetical protein [Verrucomicrobiota bacterium]